MFLLFDIGGTKMRFARSDDGISFDEPVVAETPREYGVGLAGIIEVAQMLSRGGSYGAIAGGIAGPFGKKKCSLLTSPNLSGWVGKPLCEDLEKALGAPVYIENDSALVGLGEASAGAGKASQLHLGQESHIVAYLTVSTGVGGARIVNGVIDEASVGFEPGHQIIDADKTLVPNADGTYLGNYISGKGIEKRTGKKPYENTDPSLWNETLPKLLAYGLHNTIVHWSPDIVVLGGSMICGVHGPTISLTATEAFLKEILTIFPETPPLRKAELGDYGGLHGALALLRQKHSA